MLQCQHYWFMIVAAIASYFDPRVVFYVFPLLIFQLRRSEKPHLLHSIGLLGLCGLVWFLFVTPSQLKNAYNIFMVNDASENIGSFWYIVLEMFPDKLEFMKISFLLQTVFMCVMISMHMCKTYDMLDQSEKGKESKKRESLML